MVINQQDIETSGERKEREIFIAKWAWQKFNQLFPDESSCIKELYRRVNNSDTIVCDKCKSPTIQMINTRSSLCLQCRKTSWHTAHTAFAGAKKVRPWFAALWLREQGIQVTGKQFAGLAEVSKSTGAVMVRRVALMTNKCDNNCSSSSSIQPTSGQNLIKLSEYKPLQKVQKTKKESLSIERLTTQIDLPKEESPEAKSLEQTRSANNRNDEIKKLQKDLYQLISEIPKSMETLADKLGASYQMASIACVMLELEGLITYTSDNRIVKKVKQAPAQSSRKKTIETQPRKSLEPHSSIASSLFNTLKRAFHDVSKILSKEMWQVLGYCKNCKRKLLQKKI